MLHKRFGASSEIGEPALADAILDRLVHNSYRMELDGPSLRKTMAAKKKQPLAAALFYAVMGLISTS